MGHNDTTWEGFPKSCRKYHNTENVVDVVSSKPRKRNGKKSSIVFTKDESVIHDYAEPNKEYTSKREMITQSQSFN